MKKNTAIGLVLLVVLIIIGYFVISKKSSVSTTTPTASSTVTDTDTSTDTTENPVALVPSAPNVVTNSTVIASGSVAIVNGKVKPDGALTAYWFEYGPTATLGSRTTNQIVGSGYAYNAAPGYITGLAANSQYYFRLVAQNSFGVVNGPVYPFHTNNNPAPTNALPAILSVSSSNVNRTTVTLNGQVAPKGYDTNYWFEYGTDTNFGNTSNFQSAGNAIAGQNVSMQIQNLKPLTKYYFRINAQNQFGTINSQTISFTTTGPAAATPPRATTSSAITVGSTTATLSGLVTPNLADTSYWFEYGDTSNLSHIIANTENGSVGTGNVSVPAKANITSLVRNHTYYYRIVARNSAGTTMGNIVSFTTKK